MECRILVEHSSSRQVRGNPFHVRVTCVVPHADPLVVGRHHPYHPELKNAQAAIEDAFDAMHRVAGEYRDKMNHEERPRHLPLRGEIAFLSPETDSGRIRTPEGREVYFHRNSVKQGSFDRLERGVPVRFEEEPGEEGPQAVFVKVE